MGGEIGVESKIGKGSTFWFTVVLETGSEIKKESEKKPMKEKQEISKKLSILVAEDNVINQKVAMINLKQLGHNVEIAVNGKMAVDMYNKNKCQSAGMDDYITKPFKSEDMERALKID